MDKNDGWEREKWSYDKIAEEKRTISLNWGKYNVDENKGVNIEIEKQFCWRKRTRQKNCVQKIDIEKDYII